MAVRDVLRFLFIIYCADAGMLLLTLPWSPFWDRQLIALPLAELQAAGLRPWFRGAVSGFGLLHLVWGAHDLVGWIAGRRGRGSGLAGTASRSRDR